MNLALLSLSHSLSLLSLSLSLSLSLPLSLSYHQLLDFPYYPNFVAELQEALTTLHTADPPIVTVNSGMVNGGQVAAVVNDMFSSPSKVHSTDILLLYTHLLEPY